MRTFRKALAVLGTAAVLVSLPGSATAAGPSEAASAKAAWGSCAKGTVCFWTGRGGTGQKCAFRHADRDWTQAPGVCSWSQRKNVKSVWNRGTSRASGVAYYQWRNFNTRKGCTRQGQRGNLAGTYKIKSHRWISGRCG